MRFERILRELHSEPCMILPAHHVTLSNALARIMANGGKMLDLDDLTDAAPEPYESEGVAVIPLVGVVSRELSKMERSCGGCDLSQVKGWIGQAIRNPAVRGIVLSIDSPGGSVNGTEELAAFVRDMRAVKPIVAHVAGMACSAAQYIAAGASAIYCEPSATLGSIGVYMALLDDSRRMEMEGYKVNLIRSSDTPFKAAGHPGIPLSDEQRAQMQEQIDHIFAKFTAFMRANRPGISDDAMRGQTFDGTQAVQVRLADSIATLEQAISDVRRMTI